MSAKKVHMEQREETIGELDEISTDDFFIHIKIGSED